MNIKKTLCAFITMCLIFTTQGCCNEIERYQIKIIQSSDKEYVAYSRLVREKIKDELSHIYTKDYGEGDLYLTFVVEKTGRISSMKVEQNSTVNKRIQVLTVSTLRYINFPKFPKSLPYENLVFSVLISFQL